MKPLKRDTWSINCQREKEALEAAARTAEEAVQELTQENDELRNQVEELGRLN